jgi:hypothetical protein
VRVADDEHEAVAKRWQRFAFPQPDRLGAEDLAEAVVRLARGDRPLRPQLGDQRLTF